MLSYAILLLQKCYEILKPLIKERNKTMGYRPQLDMIEKQDKTLYKGYFAKAGGSTSGPDVKPIYASYGS
jgi:hypothetical protein